MNCKSIFFVPILLTSLLACQQQPQTDLNPTLLTTHKVEGKVQCIAGNSLVGIDVTLSNGTQSFTTKTDAAGHFSFDGIQNGKNLSIDAKLPKPLPFTFTTLDMTALSKSIQNAAQINSKLSRWACDINKDGDISTKDSDALRQLMLLGGMLDNEFIFASDAFDKGTSSNTNIIINNISKDENNLLFIGTQLGDPDGRRCK